MMASSLILTLVLAADPNTLDQEVEKRVNQYLISEKASERSEILRELQKVKFSEVETALRLGTSAQAQPQSDTLQKRTYKTDYGEQEFETWVYIPKNYSPARRYRLLIALHGTGGNGANYIHTWLAWMRKREDYILAAPTIVGEPWGGSRTAHSHVHTLIRHLVQEFAINHDQIFMGGMSMGGHAAFRIGCFRADRFAGLVCRVHGPIFQPPAGQSARKDRSNLVPRFLENLGNTPLYWIVGQTDPGISIDLMRRGHERLKEWNSNVTYIEKPGGHEFYVEENDNVLKWMDEHTRKPYPTQVEFRTNRPDYNRLWWVEITRFAGRPPATVKTLDFEGKPAGTRQEYLQDAVVSATLDPQSNAITVQTKGVMQLAIFLNDKMLNLDAPVRIQVNGQVRWQKPVRRSLEVMLEDSRIRVDRSMVFSGRVTLNLP